MKKKTSMPKFFAKKLTPMLIISIIVATIANLLFAFFAMIFASMLQESRYAVTVSEIYSAVEMDGQLAEINGTEPTDESLYNRFAYALAWTTDYGQDSPYHAYCTVKNRDTNEVVATSEYNAYAVIDCEIRPMHLSNIIEIYSCGSEEFLELCRMCLDITEYDHLEVGEIYIKDEKFYPGKVTIYRTGGALGDATAVETTDFTPENPEDYECYTDFYWIDIGTKDGNADIDINNDNTWSTMQIIETGRGKFSLYMVFEYDFWADHSDTTVIILTAVVILGLIVGTIEAAVEYNNYTKQYAMDEYRKAMTNALAHDLKSPLTAIYGYAENLRNNVHSEKRDYYADAVLENVAYMNKIITDTLELAKLENTDKINADSVDVTALAEELMSKYLPVTTERGIAVKIDGDCTINADKRLISQAMENLIFNAVNFTPDNGSIEITADEKAVKIINTCDEKLTGDTKTLCQPYSKGDESRGNRKGSGLGLSIVRNIAELHKSGFEAKAENGQFTATLSFRK